MLGYRAYAQTQNRQVKSYKNVIFYRTNFPLLFEKLSLEK